VTTTSVRIYHNGVWTDLSSAVVEPLDIHLKVTDGIGRFSFYLQTEGDDILDIINPDDVVEIKINNALILKGYVDCFKPIAVDDLWVHQQRVEVTGRDYGQDLENKMVYKEVGSSFPFGFDPANPTEIYHADDIIQLMLEEAGSEVSFTSPHTAPRIVYKDAGDEYLIEAIRKICELIQYDFYVDNNKVLQLFPIGSVNSNITLKLVDGASDNNVLSELKTVKFDNFELRNRIKIVGGAVADGWTDDLPDYYGWSGASGNSVVLESTVVSTGASSIKSNRGSNANTCELTLTFPKHNYDYLPFDEYLEEEVSFDLMYKLTDGYTNIDQLYVELTDTDNHVIRWKGWSAGLATGAGGSWSKYNDNWMNCTVKVGSEVEIQPYNTLLSWVDTWRHMTVGDSFNWRIKKITFGALWGGGVGQSLSCLIVDNLRLPISMVGVAEDLTSQGYYKLREYSENNRTLVTQREIDEYAQVQLAKKKDPVSSVSCTVLGSAGISGVTNKWLAGSKVILNAPTDGFDNVELVISEAHLQVVDNPDDGCDFRVNLVLVPVEQMIRGSRLINDSNPQVAFMRQLWNQYRILDKTVAGVSAASASGGGGGYVNWNNVPYLDVKGNTNLAGVNQIHCEAPTFTWSQLEPYLWGFDGQGNWTPMNLTLPLGNAKLRFKDDTVEHENYLDVGIIYSEMTPDDPMLYVSQHLLVKKDIGCGGMLTSFQGALNLGSGLTAESDMPQIILAHSGEDYGYKNILEINDADGYLASVKVSNVYVDHINSASGSGIYLFDHLKFYNGSTGLKLYDALNSSGSTGQVLTVNSDGKPQWSASAGWNGGTVTNNILINSSQPTLAFKTSQSLSNAFGWLDFYTHTGTRQWLVGMNIAYNNGNFEMISYNNKAVYTNADICLNSGQAIRDFNDSTNRYLLIHTSLGSWVFGVHTAGYSPAFKVYATNTSSNLLSVDMSGNLSVAGGLYTINGSVLTLGQDTKVEHANNVYFNLNSSNSGTVQATLQQAGADKLILRHYSGNSYISSAAGALYLAGSTVRSQNDFVAEAGCYINTTNPAVTLQYSGSNRISVGFNGSNSFINVTNAGDFGITNQNGNLSLAASSGYIWVGNNQIIPTQYNQGQIGNSSFYWYAIYSNWFYGKNNGTFGCERALSGQEWAHEFSNSESALEFLTHELTKTKYHIKFDKDSNNKIICTCGKKTVEPCPEHRAEWNDLYIVDTGRITQATGYLALEYAVEIERLKAEVAELKKQLSKL